MSSHALRVLARRLAFGLAERLVGRSALQGPVPGRGGARYAFAVERLLGPFVVAGGALRLSGWAIDFDRGTPLAWRARLGGRRVQAAPAPRPDLKVAFARLADLPVRCGGELALPTRLGLARLAIEIETEPGIWCAVFRTLVLRLGRATGADGAVPPRRDLAATAEPSFGIAGVVRVAIPILGEPGPAHDATLASLRSQTCATWHAPPVKRLGDALAAPDAPYILPLRAGDVLAPHAIATLFAAAERHPEAAIVYADEEAKRDGALFRFIKPGWSPDTLESFDCIGAPALVRADIARGLPAVSAYDLWLRVMEPSGRRAVRVPEVLCRRALSAADAADPEGDRAALAGRLARTGRTGAVTHAMPCLALMAAEVAPPEPRPLVSIVIPTAGRELDIDGRRIDLAVDCVRGIRERSTYGEIEFVLVTNPDLPPAREQALRALGCRLVAYEDPVFNVARKINRGAAARGEFLLILNDDIEVVAPDWIERLLAQAAKPHVGVVGGKLLYTDGTIQHAGIVLVDGNPLHVRRFYPGADLGYVFSTGGARNYLAVTGACMMTRAEHFARVGGYTETFPVNFNDVDYCLKLHEIGLFAVYEPGCELIHYESVSRVAAVDPDEIARFRARWSAIVPRDPFYDATAFPLTPPAFNLVLPGSPAP